MKETSIKPMSKTELSNYYQISLYRLNQWLKPFENQIGAYSGALYTPKQVRIIFDCLGEIN